MPIPLYVTSLRILIPLLIFKWPLLGILASTFMDIKDWKLIKFQSSTDYLFYQNWDKALDIYYLAIALFVTRSWKDKLAQKLAFFLFFYRLTGDLLFFFTQNRAFLFFFPNFFESFFVFYLLFTFIFRKAKIITSQKSWWILLIFLGLPKLIHEYFLHIIKTQPWQIYNLGQKLGFSGEMEANINFYSQGLIFYILPFALGLYFLKKASDR